MARQTKVDKYGLNVRERRFADEYIANGRNATKAYKSISPNAKDTTCASKGYEWIRKGEISAYIKNKTKERLNAASLTADDIIDELITIGFARPQKGYSKQTDLTSGEVLREVEYESTAQREEQIRALELLGKSMTMFTDKSEITANVDINPLASLITHLKSDTEGDA